VQKFKRDPLVGSKVIAFLTINYWSLANQTSTSTSCDSIATLRKSASSNTCKKLTAIQRLDRQLCPFCAVTQVRLETSLSPSCDSVATPRKTAFGNSWKNLRAIQRSDWKFWPFRPVTQVLPTRPPRSDSTGTLRKTASWNACKYLITIQWSDQKLWLV